MAEQPSVLRIEWRDDFNIGIGSIDYEHRELIGLINMIFERLEAGGPEEVAGDLGEVHARIAAHFALEERIMRERKYDQFSDHKTNHERLLDDIRDIMDAYEAGTYAEQREAFAERLEDWFVAHMPTATTTATDASRGVIKEDGAGPLSNQEQWSSGPADRVHFSNVLANQPNHLRRAHFDAHE